MRAVSVNSLALLLFCTLACVLHLWGGLERRLERRERDLGPSSAKTFRALLAVPAARTTARFFNVTAGRSGGVDAKRARDNQTNTAELEDDPLEDGVFWSRSLEARLPASFSEDRARAWSLRARAQRVVSLEPGCGRTSNQLATFSDGSRACVRYGINAEQVQGETLAYYLARLLGISNVPPLVLAQPSAEQWAHVRPRVDSLQWSGRAMVSMTEWIANLSGVVTPAPLRPDGSGLRPSVDLGNRTEAELLELVQWSDLVVFDYLTANFDRLVSNLFSLQWDSRVMERNTSNLLKTPHGVLVFLDNEAGLVHGYRVLDMWERYHSSVLRSVCIFRRRTAQRVAALHRYRDARTRLFDLYRESEPLAAQQGFLSDEHARILQDRIDRVYRHILHCKGKYSQL
ncbi:four-jointed box protein 1-like [Salminus brasiliensis]|uniref:four-jointed box protein 1-like n=1 Tax=Salminus brasiliensis TaxID=930266 RepID=UPI003B8393AB